MVREWVTHYLWTIRESIIEIWVSLHIINGDIWISFHVNESSWKGHIYVVEGKHIVFKNEVYWILVLSFNVMNLITFVKNISKRNWFSILQRFVFAMTVSMTFYVSSSFIVVALFNFFFKCLIQLTTISLFIHFSGYKAFWFDLL